MPMIDTSPCNVQLADMDAAALAFDQASQALALAEENEDEPACEAARAAEHKAREAWRVAAQEVGRVVHMLVKMVEGRYS
jgi:predicted NBD/HSP70 family sugar kinase